MKNIIAQIAELHASKGWNSVYAFCRRHNIQYRLSVADFASQTPKHQSQKSDWIGAAGMNEFRAHFSSLSCHARRTGYAFNRLRAQSLTIIAC